MCIAIPEVSRTSTPLLSASWSFASVCGTQKAVICLNIALFPCDLLSCPISYTWSGHGCTLHQSTLKGHIGQLSAG